MEIFKKRIIEFKNIKGELRAFLGKIDITDSLLAADYESLLGFDFDIEMIDDCLTIKIDGIDVTDEFSKSERDSFEDELRQAQAEHYNDYDR